MAIKDSIIQEVLKSGKNNTDIRNRYQRLRLFDNDTPNVSEMVKNETNHKPDTNRTQTEHKLNTNRTQTGHKPDTASDTNRTQTGHKPDTASDTNRTQTGHKPDTKFCISSLVGLQRQVLFLLFHYCKLARADTTQELSLQHISESLKIRLGSIKTTLQRLQKKGFINRVSFKNGRSGWSKYELSDDIYREMIHMDMEHKPDTNRTQTGHKPNTQPNTSAPSSSSNNIYINTTTTDESEKNEASEFDSIDIDIEPLKGIGFSKTHILQMSSDKKLTVEMIQDSIYAFAYDLNHNKKALTIKGSPLNFFMGILRNGQPYSPPANYESPEQEAMRLYLEGKKAQLAKNQQLEEEIFAIHLKEWISTLTEAQLKAIAPKYDSEKAIGFMVHATLGEHFKQHEWPKIKASRFNQAKVQEGLNEGGRAVEVVGEPTG